MMIAKNRHQFLITQAEHHTEQSAAKVNNRYRPLYHIAPRANWMNDPNGLVFFQGRYHVFYQHHPFSASWGPMHWGHFVSDDLVHWSPLPIALAPSEAYDENGCFSGSAIQHKGKLYLFYTGHSDSKSPKEVQCMAVSEDGVTFEKFPLNPVVSAPPKEGSEDFRDPKVWKNKDSWYMVLGTGKDGHGRALLYQSTDLFTWEYVSVMNQSNGNQGYNWECPDVLSIGKKSVLMVSPEGARDTSNLYMVGEMNYTTGKFVTECTGQVDEGRDFYAPQSFQDENGRTIIIGWMNTWNTSMPSQEDGWAGALTLPRQVEFNAEGQLTFQPVSELQELRSDGVTYRNLLVTPYTENPVGDVRGTQLEMEVEYDLNGTDASRFGIKFRCAEDGSEETILHLDRSSRELRLTRTCAGAGDKTSSACRIDTTAETLHLRVFLDTSSVEVFVNGGVSVMTNRIYPLLSSDRLDVFSEGGNTLVKTLTIWRLQL